MNKFLKDYKPEPKMPGSGELIEEFLNSGKEAVVVDVERLGKTVVGVYSGLRQYAERHNMPVSVRQEEGQVILEKLTGSPPAKQTKDKDDE